MPITPHAGTLVSHGEINVDEGIVTAPEHGSPFSTRTEVRGRGPSDEGLRTFQVVVEDGQVWVELDQA